jgi:[phosphatase 2A protein]-leucine-carboxy methyltransferase
VRSTDNEALLSRVSAIEAGYLQDDAALAFARGRTLRRSPIINRGTFARCEGIDKLFVEFLEFDGSSMKQIISLGAGSDTRYFRFSKNTQYSFRYYELDFEDIVARKGSIIERNSDLQTILDTSEERKLFLMPMDLRDNIPPGTNDDIFAEIDWNLPTLILSECCLVYLDAEKANNVLSSLLSRFPRAGVIIYEPICGSDPFGQMMIHNLAVGLFAKVVQTNVKKTRGIVLRTLVQYPSLDSQKARLSSLGMNVQYAATILYIFNSWFPDRRRKIESLEMLDELEEWNLLSTHYCIVVGIKDLPIWSSLNWQ